MSLLIDGYNLLAASDIFGAAERGSAFEASRAALVAYVANTLAAKDRGRATIVFDAAGAPPGLPRRYEHEGVVVRFSKGYPDADALLEELIEAEPEPRRLLVVSSDHRVQRAARRRRATYVDSDVWLREQQRRLTEQRLRVDARAAVNEPAPGDVPLPREEVDRWLNEFGLDK